MRMFLIFVTSIILGTGLNVHATVTISAVSGTSNDVELDTDQTIEVMAGISGISRCPVGITTVTNTCNAGDRSSCNFGTTCSTTVLAITLTSDNSTGELKLVDENDSLIWNYGSYTAGESITTDEPWSRICPSVTGSPCDTATGSKTLKLGIDTNGDDTLEDYASIKFSVVGIPNTAANLSLNTGTDGVANYSLFPGDEKAYVTEFSAVEDYTVAEAAEIVGLVGFFAPGDCSSPLTVTNSSDSYFLEIDDDNKEILDNRVTEGLINDQTYLFMFGFRDKAGNIGLFKDLNSGDCVNDKHTVMPREVYGLLEDNQNCFISTAAFGSPLNSKVKTFKKFRDEYLKKFSLGKKFIKFYYKTSPPIAEIIRQNEFLKIATQVVLWPAWAVSAAVLYMGLMPFLFVVTMILLSFVVLRQEQEKRKIPSRIQKIFKKKSNKTFLIFLMSLSLSSFFPQNLNAQDDFFSTEDSMEELEEAPMEPPYTGTENDEFTEEELSELEPPEESFQSQETYNSQSLGKNPNKWKPYQRVPDEKRLEELSQKGLFKITSKGGYHYKVGQSPQNSAASFRFGMASFPNLQNPTSGVFFEDIYDTEKKPVLLVDYEWQFFRSFGKLGLKIGSGLMVASGNGQFSISQPFNGSTDAMEKYSFYMFPNSLSAIYRLDLFDRQWIVPYGEIGVDYLAFVEARDDGDDIKFGGAPHFHFAVGGSFLLDLLGRDMMAEIDRQYGVNHMWLTAEYRRLESMGGDFDFSDDIVNAGIMVEF